MSSDVVLPGQRIPIPRGPLPNLGAGTYIRDGQVRASIMGIPTHQGPVGFFFLTHLRST